MDVIIAIPARYASTRLPGKPLADIGGEAMITRVWRRCLEVGGVRKVIVATDDSRIQDVIRKEGGDAVMTSSSHQSGTDRIAEAVADEVCDLVINVQGDEPFFEPSLIGLLIEAFSGNHPPEAATLASPVRKQADLFDPSIVKVLVGVDGHAVYFSRYPIPFRHEMWNISAGEWRCSESVGFSGAPPCMKHFGVYAYRPDFLKIFTTLPRTEGENAEKLEQLRILEHGYRMKVVTTGHESFGVDTRSDLDKARIMVEKSNEK